uniref:beta strand repeat-containing protein n=1 Tax=Candidatus Vondammii sp. HM_W22 TaxID=2687299 RepID=UPI001F138D81|nr:hypothetical protein [Candidatus Vondammii sp. HM_W22]
MEAGNKLTITAGSLTNSSGILASIDSGDASITTTGILNNNDGKIQANADNLTLKGHQLLNKQGIILHAGHGVFKLTTTGGEPTGIDNQKGKIGSNQALEIIVGPEDERRNIENTSGDISGTSININADDLTSNGGSIEGDKVDINLSGNLLNGNNPEQKTGLISALSTAVDALKLTVEGWFDNDAGTTQTNAETSTITAGSLSNSGKIIHTGNGTLTLKITDGATDNTRGEITSNGHLAMAGKSLDNTDAIIRTNQGDLNLTLTDSLINTDGLIEAENNLTIIAGSLTNSGGTLTSIGSGNASITTTGILNNDSGTIESNADNLSLTGSDLTNDKGKIVHRGHGHLTVKAAEISNRGGSIGSLGHFIAREFGTLDNSLWDGVMAEIQADHIELDGTTIDNTGGRLYATGGNSIDLTADSLINDKGTVNSEGNLDLTLQQLSNNRGSFQSDSILTLDLPAFNFSDGSFNAATSLIISTSGDVTNGVGNRLLTDGNLIVDTDGSIINEGEISSLLNLTLTGTSLSNEGSGIISSGNDLTLDFDRTITNRNRLSAAKDITLDAENLDNYGTVSAGEDLNITLTNNLNNNNTLFAGNDAKLYVSNTLYNFEGADIFALNDIIIAANSNNNANKNITNESATIEAYGGDIKTLYGRTY